MAHRDNAANRNQIVPDVARQAFAPSEYRTNPSDPIGQPCQRRCRPPPGGCFLSQTPSSPSTARSAAEAAEGFFNRFVRLGRGLRKIAITARSGDPPLWRTPRPPRAPTSCQGRPRPVCWSGESGGPRAAPRSVDGHGARIMGPLGAILAVLEVSCRPSWSILAVLAAIWDRLGALLGQFWGPLGPSWDHLGGLLGALGAILGASCAVLGRRKAEKEQMPKSFKHLWKINEFCLFGHSWRSS